MAFPLQVSGSSKLTSKLGTLELQFLHISALWTFLISLNFSSNHLAQTPPFYSPPQLVLCLHLLSSPQAAEQVE